jgi:hypothetical protein
MLTSGAVLLHDSVCLHTAARTQTLLEHFNWQLFDHTSYSPDLASSNYHLFTYLKNWLGSQRFNKDTQKNIPRSKFLNSGGMLKSSLSRYVRVFFLHKMFLFLIPCFLTDHRKLLSEDKRIISAVKRVQFVCDRVSYIILKGQWCGIIVLNVHAPA